MTIALCPGTFDPFTYGHLDMVRQCLSFSDTVIIGVARNSKKTPLLELPKRLELIEATLREVELDTKTQVEIIDGLLAEYATEQHVDVIVKGLRNAADFDYENPMSQMNRQIGAPPTVFVACKPAFMHVSSSLVKEVASLGGNVYTMVSADTADALYAAYRRTPPKHGDNVIEARFDLSSK